MTEFTQPFPWPVLAAGCGVAALIVVVSHALSKGPKGPGVRVGLALLRLLALAILVVCLLDPHRVERIPHPRRVRLAVLQDTSRSMATADVPGGRLDAAKAWLEQLKPGFASGVELVPFSFDDAMRPWTNGASSPSGPASAIASALDEIGRAHV